jgi:hypothetical protein
MRFYVAGLVISITVMRRRFRTWTNGSAGVFGVSFASVLWDVVAVVGRIINVGRMRTLLSLAFRLVAEFLRQAIFTISNGTIGQS